MWSSSPYQFNGGLPPDSPLKHYEDTCQALKRDNKLEELDAFILQTADALMRFKNETTKKRRKIVVDCDGGKIRYDDKSGIRAAASNYFNAASVPLLIRQQYLSYLDLNVPFGNRGGLGGQPETLDTLLQNLTCCEAPDAIMLADYAVCGECGMKVEGSDCFMANFADMHSSPNKSMQVEEPTAAASDSVNENVPPRLTWSNILQKMRTMVVTLGTVQGHKVQPFEMAKWNQWIKRTILPLSPEQRQRITHQEVWELLRKEGPNMKDLYKNTPTIWSGITSKPLDEIPEGCTWVILNVVLPRLFYFIATGTNERFDTSWDLQRSNHCKQNPSTISIPHGKEIRNAVIILRKCMQICGEKRFLHLIIGQNGDEQKARVNDLWRAFCRHNEWRM